MDNERINLLGERLEGTLKTSQAAAKLFDNDIHLLTLIAVAKDGCELLAEVRKLIAERDAAVSDMLVLVKSHCVCDVCKHGRDNGEDRVPCEYEKWCSQQLWEWRGLCSDNTDAPTDAESEEIK